MLAEPAEEREKERREKVQSLGRGCVDLAEAQSIPDGVRILLREQLGKSGYLVSNATQISFFVEGAVAKNP